MVAVELTVEPGLEGLHRLLTSLVSPRPIGWISTQDAAGRANLAPYSYFNAVSSDPPVVMFSAGATSAGRKDTPRNAIESGEFVANLVTEAVLEPMDMTSASLAHGDSEFAFADLTPEPARTVAPPRVGEAIAHLECTVHDVVEVYDNTVIFGDVRHVHVDGDLLVDGRIAAESVGTVGRMGGPLYTLSRPLEYTRRRYSVEGD